MDGQWGVERNFEEWEGLQGGAVPDMMESSGDELVGKRGENGDVEGSWPPKLGE